MQFRRVMAVTLAGCLAGATWLGASAPEPAYAQPAEEQPAEEKPAEEPADEAPAENGGDDAAKTDDAGQGEGDAAGQGDGADGDGATGDQPAGDTTPPKTDAPDDGGMDGATYAVRLRDLQQRIDQLKEQIRRSHTRLSLLSDTILAGGGSGSRASVSLQNKFSNQFRLTRALVVLDGAVQYNKQDLSGALHDQKNIPIFNGSIPPGDHTVQVLINLRGHGYGVFSYLRGYKFEVRSSHSFTAVEGKTSQLRILAYEKGGVTTKLEERPAVRFIEKVQTGLIDAGGQPAN